MVLPHPSLVKSSPIAPVHVELSTACPVRPNDRGVHYVPTELLLRYIGIDRKAPILDANFEVVHSRHA